MSHHREKNNELEDTVITTIQNKILREKKTEQQSTSELWDTSEL